MEPIVSAFRTAFVDQIPGKELTVGVMAIRAIFVFITWVVIVRFTDRRMLGQYSAFDTVLAVMIGALLGRTINGGAPLWATLAAVLAIVAVHWCLAIVTHRSHRLGKWIKGVPRQLVADGKIDWRAMRRNLITENDLLEMLRLHTQIGSASEAQLAILERNGQISSIPFRK